MPKAGSFQRNPRRLRHVELAHLVLDVRVVLQRDEPVGEARRDEQARPSTARSSTPNDRPGRRRRSAEVDDHVVDRTP